MAGTLILVRHGESEWNLKNLFTGWKNPDLTEKGIERGPRRRQEAQGGGHHARLSTSPRRCAGPSTRST